MRSTKELERMELDVQIAQEKKRILAERGVEGSTGSSEKIPENLEHLQKALEGLEKDYFDNLNSNTRSGQQWQAYFDKYGNYKRKMVELQLKVELVDPEQLGELKATLQWYNHENRQKYIAHAPIEQQAFDHGILETWLPWNKERIDIQTKILKLRGQIRQVEPPIEEIKRAIKRLQELQQDYENYNPNATPGADHSMKEADLKKIANAFAKVKFRIEALQSNAKGVKRKFESPELTKLDKTREPIEFTWKKHCSGSAAQHKDERCFGWKVEVMKLDVQIAEAKMEILTNPKATASSTDKAVLTPGTSQAEEEGVKRKRKQSSDEIPVKRHYPDLAASIPKS